MGFLSTSSSYLCCHFLFADVCFFVPTHNTDTNSRYLGGFRFLSHPADAALKGNSTVAALTHFCEHPRGMPTYGKAIFDEKKKNPKQRKSPGAVELIAHDLLCCSEMRVLLLSSKGSRKRKGQRQSSCANTRYMHAKGDLLGVFTLARTVSALAFTPLLSCGYNCTLQGGGGSTVTFFLQ